MSYVFGTQKYGWLVSSSFQEASKLITEARGTINSEAAQVAMSNLQKHAQKMRLMEVELESIARFGTDAHGVTLSALKANQMLEQACGVAEEIAESMEVVRSLLKTATRGTAAPSTLALAIRGRGRGRGRK